MARGRRATAATVGSAPWFFTCVLSFEPEGTGTRYTATAIHANRAQAEAHEKMGFSQGWGLVLDQLVDYIRRTPGF